MGDTNLHLSKALPNSLEDWQEYYTSKVRSNKELQELGERFYSIIQENILPFIEGISEEECVRYVRELALDRTFQGYVSRLKIHQEHLLESTGALFIYKYEHPHDWRFKTFAIDLYHHDPAKDRLVGIKFLPETARRSRIRFAQEVKAEIESEHKRLGEIEAGTFQILYYRKKKESNYSIVPEEGFNKVLEVFGKS